jgi:hypothetical protein
VVGPLIVAPLVGPVVGFLVFWLLGLGDRELYIAGGALIGLLVGCIVALMQRGAAMLVLTEARVSVPQLSELRFVVNVEYRRVAWRLFVESMSRVATQPLSEDQGLLREAMSSLYGLFSTTRELLKDMQPTKVPDGVMTVEMLAMEMLNREIRPFLSTWHPRLRDWELNNPGRPESAWEQAQACRQDLEDLRRRMLRYGRAFGELAQVSQLDRFFSDAGTR